MKYAIGLTIAILIAFIGIKFWYTKAMWSSLANADQIELRATYDRWVEAGRPEGVALQEFLRGRGSIIASTQTFILNGSVYSGLLENTNVRAGEGRTLIITSNKLLYYRNYAGGITTIE